MLVQLVLPPLLFLLLGQGLYAHENDGCPHNFRRCNYECLDRNNNHTAPCEQGPWGKCLSPNFPFFCSLSNTCIRKDEICGDHCFSGNPGAFWYHHRDNKNNTWKLEEGAFDRMHKVTNNIKVPKWLERYNCNGECKTYLESCSGACDHPDGFQFGGITLNFTSSVDLFKCGRECRDDMHGFHDCGDECLPQSMQCNGACPTNLFKCGRECRKKNDMKGFHDCGDECLPQSMQCNGTCPNATLTYDTVPQWKCGNECRPEEEQEYEDEYYYEDEDELKDSGCEDKNGDGSDKRWRGCPDGSCRDKTVSCEGVLPGTCPPDKVLCTYNNRRYGTDFECRCKKTHYVCNATRNKDGKHEDNSCKLNSELCGEECVPGYLKCMNLPSYGSYGCVNSKEYIQCGEKCKESSKYHECNGTCISTADMCHGSCAYGFRECEGKCVLSSDSSFIDCNGKCQSASKQCDDSCSTGYFKVGDICVSDEEQYRYHECDGVFIDLETPCNGLCSDDREMCRGDRCLKSWQTIQCEGECIHKNDLCNGSCKDSQLVPCGDQCIRNSAPCEGKCHHVDYPFMCMIYGNFECLHISKIGDGSNNCEDGSDEITKCLQGWRCNGKLQCINKPCHDHGPAENICPETVKKILVPGRSYTAMYKTYYCEEEDECKLEGVPCGGKCIVDLEKKITGWGADQWEMKAEHQFACHDGSKCVKREGKYFEIDICDGENDCADRSDEICKCNGNIDCNGRIHAKKTGFASFSYEFVCKSKDEKVELKQYCDGVEDCKDASDEKGCDKCPGLTRCKNGHFTCANVPCNNTVYNTASNSSLPEFTCEGESVLRSFKKKNQEEPGVGGHWSWDLCEEQDAEPKCVKKTSRQITKGQLCNGQCHSSWPYRSQDKVYRCEDTCLPIQWEYPDDLQFSCNGSCEYFNNNDRFWSLPFNQYHPGDKRLVHCGEYCVKMNALRYTGQDRNAINCGGECRMFSSISQRKSASRKICNGVCAPGNGDEPWFSCATGDQCYSEEEWCNGVSDCDDGTDEASCSQCPLIRKCQHQEHPLVNQTSSKGPRLSDYVCSDEPCGECSDSAQFPCGNTCITIEQICPLSGRCSPSMFQCGDQCLHLEAVCNGKVDCVNGIDEATCHDNMGSWMCDGNFQSRSIPC